ncbi:uncharacterized protein [Haliotis asinina]|uniref:uncharacterized protein n=1 Tax=Haliotis asinina TaxID=109174 RepID=UPI0035318108
MDSRSPEVHRKDIKRDCTIRLENKEAKQKRCMTERKTVNDRSTSVSCWTLPMMCKYIDFRRDVSRWLRGNIEKDRPTFQKNSIESKHSYYSGIERFTSDQSTRSMTEAEVKHIVFVMICPLLEQLELRMNAEETIDMGCMPSCRLDYVLKTGGIPVGAIEVKCKDSFDENAFAQAVIQLVVLQQWAYKKGLPFHVDMTQVPIVNILTDGERFVLMKLEGEKLYVQKTKPRGHSLHQELVVRCISQDFGDVYKQLQDALSHAVSKLTQLLKSHELDETYTHADGCQGEAPVHRNKHKYPDEISINPLSNENKWRGFLSPLREKKRKRKVASCGSVDDTIQGPTSLSRTFATKLGDVFYFKPKARASEGGIQSQQKKRKIERHQRHQKMVHKQPLKLDDDKMGKTYRIFGTKAQVPSTTRRVGEGTVHPTKGIKKEPGL